MHTNIDHFDFLSLESCCKSILNIDNVIFSDCQVISKMCKKNILFHTSAIANIPFIIDTNEILFYNTHLF